MPGPVSLLAGLLIAVVIMTDAVVAAPVDASFTPDPWVGVYRGVGEGEAGQCLAEATITATGAGRYQMAIRLPDAGETETIALELARTEGEDEITFRHRAEGVDWQGQVRLKGSETVVYLKNEQRKFKLKKVVMQSPTLDAPPPPGAIELLPWREGEAPGMNEWSNNTWPALADGSMQVGRRDNTTRRKFGSYQLHLEFMIPAEPEGRGQKRGNSGVFLNERYEIQVLDSFGFGAEKDSCGAVYGLAPPWVNASYPPLAWQTYDIDFFGPLLDDKGRIMALPKVTVRHNGVLIHEGREIERPTDIKRFGHQGRGRIVLQDHRHPVRYRNIWVVEK